ncbi:MAG: hypothetical protein ACI35R_13120 [Bacillus sp. (in: firmicutes)]
MKKCISCIWRLKVNESVSLCPFKRCVKTEGWKVDEKDEEKEEAVEG